MTITMQTQLRPINQEHSTVRTRTPKDNIINMNRTCIDGYNLTLIKVRPNPLNRNHQSAIEFSRGIGKENNVAIRTSDELAMKLYTKMARESLAFSSENTKRIERDEPTIPFKYTPVSIDGNAPYKFEVPIKNLQDFPDIKQFLQHDVATENSPHSSLTPQNEDSPVRDSRASLTPQNEDSLVNNSHAMIPDESRSLTDSEMDSSAARKKNQIMLITGLVIAAVGSLAAIIGPSLALSDQETPAAEVDPEAKATLAGSIAENGKIKEMYTDPNGQGSDWELNSDGNAELTEAGKAKAKEAYDTAYKKEFDLAQEESNVINEKNKAIKDNINNRLAPTVGVGVAALALGIAIPSIGTLINKHKNHGGHA